MHKNERISKVQIKNYLLITQFSMYCITNTAGEAAVAVLPSRRRLFYRQVTTQTFQIECQQRTACEAGRNAKRPAGARS